MRCSYLIIGGGIAGLSTAWHLARAGRGRDTVLLEAEPQLGAHSTARNAAILRTLGSDPLSTRIALAGARFLRDPPQGFAEVPLVDRRGLVLAAAEDFADELSGWVKDVAGAARIEAVAGAALSELLPAYRDDVAAAYLLPEEGQIDIAALVQGFVKGARRGGVELRRDQRVSALLRRGDRVVGARLASGEPLHAEQVVVAAGGWAGRLARAAGSRVVLRPTRRHLMVTEPSDAIGRRWPVLWRLGAGEFYCRPESGGLLLCACEIHDADPDQERVDRDVADAIAAKAARYLPVLADLGASHFWSGIRTLTGDGRFAIGPDPDVDGLFWVAGLAGAGMVCSSEIGRIAADGLLGRAGDPEVSAALHPGRLAR